MIVNPNREMVYQMSFQLQSKFCRYVDEGRVEVRTVHSALGIDVNIVIAVLGKEYKIEKMDENTIYYNIYKALNVQLSRHKGIVFIIGNVELIAETASKLKNYSYVSRIREAINEFKKTDSIINKEM